MTNHDFQLGDRVVITADLHGHVMAGAPGIVVEIPDEYLVHVQVAARDGRRLNTCHGIFAVPINSVVLRQNFSTEVEGQWTHQ